MKNWFKNKYYQLVSLFLFGIFIGWILFHTPGSRESRKNIKTQAEKEIWICSMHPQIRQEKPGKCPICGMDLITLHQQNPSKDKTSIELSYEMVQLANVQTSLIKKEKPEKEVRMYGKIEADERLIQTIPAHIPGRIEKLLINFTGDAVVKGQTIAIIYSPTLIQAQQELIEAKKLSNTMPGALDAAREKLRQWKLTDQQISDIEKNESIISNFEVKSTISGIITNKMVNQGDYISQGSPLYELSDLSKVWIQFDAYESDLPWLKKGDKIQFTLQSLPGRTFSSTLTFIAPVIDNLSRVVKVRSEISNTERIFKPGMFVTGIIKAKLPDFKENIIIPNSAVLWTGKRSIVYIKVKDAQLPTFEMKEVELGPETGNGYVILSGLTEGEEIVTNGVFSIDAAAQLAGKPSMMNPVSTSKNQQIPDFKNRISSNASRDLSLIFGLYIEFKDKLIASDSKEAYIESKKLFTQIESVNPSVLPIESQEYWITRTKLISGFLKEIKENSSIDEIRKSFVLISENLIKLFKAFGTGNNKAYIQFCPMANQNIGAFWLSSQKQIKNPYYGEMMLSCGETRDTLR